jgi:hypothetical protein
MGLDVILCRFRNLDTEAILKFSRLSSESWAFEVGAGAKLKAGARELGLPESIISEPYFGGERISFPSRKHPELPVGDWSSFRSTRELIEHFTGKNFLFVFPEAEGSPAYIRPVWSASRKRLAEILEEVQKLNFRQIESFIAVFVKPHIPPYLLERARPADCATTMELFAGYAAQIEVMIETLDYVLNDEHPQEFLLSWSG